MDRLSSLLQAEAATLFMLDAEKQELWSRVLRGGGLDEIRLPLGTGHRRARDGHRARACCSAMRTPTRTSIPTSTG